MITPGAPYDDSELCQPPAGATALSAIRVLPDGSMRQYSISGGSQGYASIERFIRMLRAFGYIQPSSGEHVEYAVLDVLNDDDDDIIADYHIPTAAAWRYVYRQLRLRVVGGEPR